MKVAVLILVLVMATTVEAKPRHRVADWKFWVMAAANIGTSIATTTTIQRCKHDHGPDQCIGGGYAPMPPTETIRTATVVSMVSLSYFWKRQDDEGGAKHKLWWLYDVGPMAFNGAIIARNANRTFKAKDLN